MTVICRIPWFCVTAPTNLFLFFSGVDIHTEISLEIETKYIAGSNAFDPKEKVEGKVSKRLSSTDAPKKLARKSHILTLYTASHSEDLRIQDLRSISIGFPTVKMYHFWTNFFGEFTEVGEPFWYFHFDFFLRIKSIRPGNIFSFNFQRDFGVNSNTRKIKKINFARAVTQNQGIRHISVISRSNLVKSH